ncbi:MAG: phBC6A51 family helix-turn-helix protein [bacterium]|nr:phBC6A51 family helix-turn-helix protein [bacterium]
MATSNIQKRTGVNINDLSRKRKLLALEMKKPPQKIATPPIFTPSVPRTAKLKGRPILSLKKADLADKKEKSLFKFLDDSGVEQPDKLLVFVRWFGLPRKLRKPETQEKLGEKIGIHKDTFANWKRRAGFWKEVSLYSNNYFLSHAPDVYYALVQYAIKTGDPSAVKLYAQRFEGWSEKIRTEDETPEKELDPELKSAIALAIKNIGLASILKNYEQSDVEETE